MGETRDKVLALYRDGKTTPKEIAEALGGSYDNAARHLRLLKRDGLLHPDHPDTLAPDTSPTVETPQEAPQDQERGKKKNGRRPMTQARFQRGDKVTVHEENITPWSGVVTTVKWSHVSGWWVSIRRPDGVEYQVVERLVRRNRRGGSPGTGVGGRSQRVEGRRTMTAVNFKDVGKGPDDVIRKSGTEGLATIVGFWMFTHNDKRGQFWGSVNTALRQLYGDDVRALTKTEARQIQKRLTREGFLFIRTENGPRWQPPQTWTWDHREESEPEPIPQPPPGPVTVAFRCKVCGDRFDTTVQLMQHWNREHSSHHRPYEVQQTVLKAVKANPGLTAVELSRVLEGYSYSSVVHAARGLVKRGKLRQETVGGKKRGKTRGYDIELYPVRWRKLAPAPKVPEEAPETPESVLQEEPEEPERVILRPDGKMYRVVRTLPDGSVELEVLS